MFCEVVLENCEEQKMADKYSVKRTELCSALDLGGITPAYGIIESVMDVAISDVHLMIRPRTGGFIYNQNEISIMKADIERASEFQCKGVVFGAVTNEKEIDLYNASLLLEYAKGLNLEVTFHRAFDFTNDIFKSMEVLIRLGFNSVLTSGGKNTISDGVINLRKLAQNYSQNIQIIAGGGVSKEIAKELLNEGLRNIHFNIRKPSEIQSNILMGTEYGIDEDKIREITLMHQQIASS